jgi:hypothetical protein
MPGGRGHEGGDGSIVVVPPAPGPLLWPDGDRNRDGLDELIDDLLPDTDEGPGFTDAALLAGGGGLLGWTIVGSPPAVVTVAGAVALGLGCILPLRAGWRWVASRRRSKRLAGSLAMRADTPALARLAAAYETVDGLPATTASARAAAHGALLEVASLLAGGTPDSDSERRYVDARVSAVEELADALRQIVPGDPAVEEPAAVDPELLVAAREELDALSGASALAHLQDITAEMRARERRR